ncbi:MAG: hypothetical protein H0U03_01600 [Actinobacteria bacterium]|nr:hypothetical protein [Actinomycetota bacterium]
MTDQEDRERESRESGETKFHEATAEESADREDAAERLQDEQEPGQNVP